MLAKEKKDEVRAFLKESPHISLQNVALLYDVTYAQVYALNREVHGVKPRVKKAAKKPAVKAKAKMSRKAILAKAGEAASKLQGATVNVGPLEGMDLNYEVMYQISRGKQGRIEEASFVDLINQPPHYTKGGIETIDFIEAKDLNYNLGNVVKYVSRSGLKGTRIEDLKKAKWYLEREISSLLGD